MNPPSQGASDAQNSKEISNYNDRSRIVDPQRSVYGAPLSSNSDADQFYRKYNEEYLKNYELLYNGKGVYPIYQKNLLSKLDSQYQKDDQKDPIINQQKISPLIKALENENQILKGESESLSRDLSLFVGMIDLLLEENKNIREHINQQNKDIQKIIETIGLNDGEEIHDLNHQIHLLNEQNNILLKHLEENQKFREMYQENQLNNQREIQEAQLLFEREKEEQNNLFQRTESLEKQNFTINNELEKIRDQEHQLRQEFIKIKRENQYLVQDDEKLRAQYDQEIKQNEKTQFEHQSEIDRLRQELDEKEIQLKNRIQLIEQSKKQREQQIYDAQKMENYIKTLEQKLKEKTDLSEDNAYLLNLQKARTQAALAREKATLIQKDQALNEKQKIQTQFILVDKQYKHLLDSSKNDIQEKHKKYENLVTKLKEDIREKLQKKDEQISQLRKRVDEQAKDLEKLRKEKENYSRQTSELQSKLVYHNENRQIIENQSIELRKQENQVVELQSLLNEYKMQLQGGPQNQEHSEILSQRIIQLEEQIENLQQSKKELEDIKRDNEEVLEKCNQLELDNQDLRNQNESYQKENTTLQDSHDLLLIQLSEIRLTNVYDQPLQVKENIKAQQNYSLASTYDRNTGGDFYKNTMQTSGSKTRLGIIPNQTTENQFHNNIPVITSTNNQNSNTGFSFTPLNTNFSNNVYLKK